MFVESGFSWQNTDIVWCAGCGEVEPDEMIDAYCLDCSEEG